MSSDLGRRSRFRQLPLPLAQMARFAAVGMVNTTVDIGLFWLLHDPLGVPYLIANVISYSAGVINSFVMNKLWTFAETRRHGRVSQQFRLFIAINLASLGLSTLVLWVLSGGLGVMTAKLVATVASFVCNFWASRKFVYRAR